MPTPTLTALAHERFVSLTTYRRDGRGVATPVWVARDGDALVVITPEGTGKLKRLRHTSRVTLRPCDRRGRVAPDGRAPHPGTRSQNRTAGRANARPAVRAER